MGFQLLPPPLYIFMGLVGGIYLFYWAMKERNKTPLSILGVPFGLLGILVATRKVIETYLLSALVYLGLVEKLIYLLAIVSLIQMLVMVLKHGNRKAKIYGILSFICFAFLAIFIVYDIYF